MNNLNIEQLKEFFEFRADTQDRRISQIENSIDEIGKIVSSVAVKVNVIWGAIGTIGVMAITAILKALGVV